jgi:hypothetical protein
VHLVGIIVGIYYDARTSERQKYKKYFTRAREGISTRICSVTDLSLFNRILVSNKTHNLCEIYTL